MIDTLLKMSATGTAVICMVMLLRLFLRRAPKIFSYALWLIVLFRLLCPVSVFNLVPSARAGITEQLSMQEHLGEMDVTLSESFEGADVQTGALPTDPAAEKSPGSEHLRGSQDAMEVTSLWSWKLVAFVIWLPGVCMMLVYAIVSILHLHKRLKYASLDRENIYLLDGISSPFVAGVLRPNIYLPYGLGENEKTYILLHEQTHIRRGDPLFRVLAYMALALHWFNPFVWVAFFLSGRDMEMSCDEMVLRRLGSKIKCDYSDSLLAMAQGKRAIGFTPLAFGEGDTGKRIKNVLNYKKTTLQVVMVGVLVVALAGIALGAENGSFTQIAGSRIEWNQNGSLIYDSDEMLMFFHELGHYLNTSHLLVGMEDLKIRTDPVCDEDHYTYANFAPTCFPDPYKGMDVR